MAIFMKGLKQPLKGLIRAFDTTTLQDTIKKALALKSSSTTPTKEVYQPPHKRGTATNQEEKQNKRGSFQKKSKKLCTNQKTFGTTK